MQSCNRRNLFKSCCCHQIQNKLNMSKKDDCQPSIFFKFSKAFHCLGTLSCNTVVSSALTPATLRRSVCVFSPLTDALVCFSGCETKPLPYYSTSLQIGTSLRPVPLISFFFYEGSTLVPKRGPRSAALRCTALHDDTLQSLLSLSLSGEASVDSSSVPRTCSRCRFNLQPHPARVSPHNTSLSWVPKPDYIMSGISNGA